MAFLESLIGFIDNLTERIGRGLGWLVLLMAALTTLVVFSRYVLDTGSIAMQEAITYLHATVFLAGMGYALRHDAHVRVDIFYQHFSTRLKAWVNAAGILVLLLPTCLFIGWISFDLVSHSWAIRETSSDTGGIPAVFLLKTLILVFSALMFLQGLAELLRNTLTLINSPQNKQEQGKSPEKGT
jgi:TRAP-type mannitol/chloroaromatic compound transport system permease small subunit